MAVLVNYEADPRQSDRLVDYQKDKFTDVADSDEFSGLPDRGLAIILTSSSDVVCAGIWKKDRGVATGKVRFAVSDCMWLNIPVSIEGLSLPDGFLTSAPNDEVRRAIAQGEHAQPSFLSHVDNIIRLLDVPRYIEEELSDREYRILAQERDVVNMLLETFGVNRTFLEKWAPRDHGHFLDGISESAGEDGVIVEECSNLFSDWDAVVEDHVRGRYVFRSEGTGVKLHIVNVNRKNLERTLGVDVVIYNEFYDSYVFVQYKMMRPEKRKVGGTHQVFRPEEQLKKEVARMKKWRKALRATKGPVSPRGFRLRSDPFMIKICPSSSTRAASGRKMLAGMTLPLAYYESIVRDSKFGRGKQGGIALTYNNVGRYITNQEFKMLVEKGWVGTRGGATSVYNDIVARSVGQSRSVFLAWAEKTREKLVAQPDD